MLSRDFDCIEKLRCQALVVTGCCLFFLLYQWNNSYFMVRCKNSLLSLMKISFRSLINSEGLKQPSQNSNKGVGWRVPC